VRDTNSDALRQIKALNLKLKPRPSLDAALGIEISNLMAFYRNPQGMPRCDGCICTQWRLAAGRCGLCPIIGGVCNGAAVVQCVKFIERR